MATAREYEELLNRVGVLRDQLTTRLSGDLIANPQLADLLTAEVDRLLATALEAEARQPLPKDHGFSELVGIGPEAATDLGATRLPAQVQPYDETVTSERIIATGDLYYIYQHERIGVFKAVQKLQDLFKAGTVRLSTGSGAFGLYQFDKRQVLRYTKRDRLAAYRRAFGYGVAPLPAGARANATFHRLFVNFMDSVAQYWRDKRVSDVIRERAADPSFGSAAMVRRAGLDLRNNLKWASYGHLNVLRVEVMQLLDEVFRILGTEDVKRIFGADNAWDVIEDILSQHFKQPIDSSPRQRMAVAGRDVLRWLAQPHILQTSRVEFESLLNEIGDEAEEWITSAQAVGVANPQSRSRPPRLATEKTASNGQSFALN